MAGLSERVVTSLTCRGKVKGLAPRACGLPTVQRQEYRVRTDCTSKGRSTVTLTIREDDLLSSLPQLLGPQVKFPAHSVVDVQHGAVEKLGVEDLAILAVQVHGGPVLRDLRDSHLQPITNRL